MPHRGSDELGWDGMQPNVNPFPDRERMVANDFLDKAPQVCVPAAPSVTTLCYHPLLPPSDTTLCYHYASPHL